MREIELTQHMNLIKGAGSILVGGILFWVPMEAIELITRHDLGFGIGTVVPLASALLVYLFLGRFVRALCTRWTSIWMLAGIYLLGPQMASIGTAAFGGSGTFDPVNMLIAGLVPFFTFEMAPGAAFGILLASGVLIWIHCRF